MGRVEGVLRRGKRGRWKGLGLGKGSWIVQRGPVLYGRKEGEWRMGRDEWGRTFSLLLGTREIPKRSI